MKTNTYSILKKTIQGCSDCDLRYTRKRVVRTARLQFGLKGITIFLISDYPTITDEALGRFGEGPEHKLIRELVGRASQTIQVRDLYFTGMVRCHAGNEWIFPAPAERLACAKWLHREIDLLEPDLILFNGTDVFDKYKKEYKNGITIHNIGLMVKHGGVSAPYYATIHRTLKEALNGCKKKQSYKII